MRKRTIAEEEFKELPLIEKRKVIIREALAYAYGIDSKWRVMRGCTLNTSSHSGDISLADVPILELDQKVDHCYVCMRGLLCMVALFETNNRYFTKWQMETVGYADSASPLDKILQEYWPFENIQLIENFFEVRDHYRVTGENPMYNRQFIDEWSTIYDPRIDLEPRRMSGRDVAIGILENMLANEEGLFKP